MTRAGSRRSISLRILAPLLLGAALVVLGLWLPWAPWNAPSRGGGADGSGRPTEAEAPADRIRAVHRLGALPASTLTLPVVYESDRMMDDLESMVPARFGGLADRQAFPAVPGAEYAFEAERGPLQVEVSRDTVRITTEVRYGGRLWYRTPFGMELTAACGVTGSETAPDAPRAVVTMSSPIEIREDWTLGSNAAVERVERAEGSGPCIVNVPPLRLDATDVILAAVWSALERDAEEIERVLAEVEIRPYIESYWATMRRPIELAPGTWLTLNPEGLRFVPDAPSNVAESRRTAPDAVRGRVEVTARPRVTLGHRPSSAQTSLPSPDSDPSAHASRPRGGVVVEGQADYPALSELATSIVQGREFEFAGRVLRVEQVTVAGAGNGRISVEADVTGGMEARVRLEGTPAYDPEPRVLSFPDLEYSVEGGPMARFAAWATRVFMPGYLRERLRLPVEDLLSDGGSLSARSALDMDFDGGARLHGSLEGLEVTELAATERGLIVRSRVETDALLHIGSEASAQ